MPYSIEWLQPESILLVHLADQVTLEEAINMNTEFIKYLDQASGRLHFLFDFARIASVPLNIHKVGETTAYLRHPQLGWIAACGIENSFMKMMGAIILQISRANIRFFTDYDEALSFLEDQVAI